MKYMGDFVGGWLSGCCIFVIFFASDESFKVNWIHRYKYAKNKMCRCARSQGHRRAGTVNRLGAQPVLSGSNRSAHKKALYYSRTKIYLFLSIASLNLSYSHFCGKASIQHNLTS